MDSQSNELRTNETLLTAIRRHLPLYPGYGSVEERRLSDTLLREHCFEELLQLRKSIIQSEPSPPDSDRDEKLINIRLLENDLGSLIHRLKFASYGTTRFFQEPLVEDSVVHGILELDLSILDSLGALGAAVFDEEDAARRMDSLLTIVRRILFEIQEIHEFLDLRARRILGRRRPDSP